MEDGDRKYFTKKRIEKEHCKIIATKINWKITTMHKKGENKIYEKNDVTKEFILKCNITLGGGWGKTAKKYMRKTAPTLYYSLTLLIL